MLIQALLLMWGVIVWFFLFLNWYVAPTWLMLFSAVLAVGVFIYEYSTSIQRQSSKRNGRDTVALSAALVLMDGLLAAWMNHAWSLDGVTPLFAVQAVLVTATVLSLYVGFRYRRLMNHRHVARLSGRQKEGYLKNSKGIQRTPQQRRRQKETEQDGLASLVLGREAKDE